MWAEVLLMEILGAVLLVFSGVAWRDGRSPWFTLCLAVLCECVAAFGATSL